MNIRDNICRDCGAVSDEDGDQKCLIGMTDGRVQRCHGLELWKEPVKQQQESSNQEVISKMETVDVEKERERFEYWFSDEGSAPKAIERIGRLYALAQAQMSWQAWIAAKKQAMEGLELARIEWRCRATPDGEWSSWAKGSTEFIKGIGGSRISGDYEYQTRHLYAKKGE